MHTQEAVDDGSSTQVPIIYKGEETEFLAPGFALAKPWPL